MRRSVRRSAQRSRQQAAQLGKLDLGQSATSQCLRAQAQTEFTARPGNEHRVRPDAAHRQQFVGGLVCHVRRAEFHVNLVGLACRRTPCRER